MSCMYGRKFENRRLRINMTKVVSRSAIGGRNKPQGWLITHLIHSLTESHGEENHQNFINNSTIRPGLPEYINSSHYHGAEAKVTDKKQMRHLFTDKDITRRKGRSLYVRTVSLKLTYIIINPDDWHDPLTARINNFKWMYVLSTLCS